MSVTKKKKTKRRKHVPQRTCVGCRTVEPKMTMVRIVRSPDGVQIDHDGRANGRGAYLHKNLACWEQAVKGSLAKALRTELTDQEIEQLRSYFEGIHDPETETAP